MLLDDFDYHLPDELIAQAPAAQRSASRLLHLDGVTGALQDRRFADVLELLQPGDLLVLNDTRVIKARLTGRKATGGQIEVLIERVLDRHEALAQIRASHAPKAGAMLLLGEAIKAEVLGREDDLYRLRFGGGDGVHALLERHGSVPLPPYITHDPDAGDETRYQTVYAKTPGAVAAPTAGLHFDAALLDALRARGVGVAYLTLHVGAGTFQPVRTQNLAEHRMHGEWYSLPQETVDALRATRAAGGRVVAAGTTSLRALEAAAAEGDPVAGDAETALFILPGYRFRVVDRLITNFHLPKSTLLMLVSAFGGVDNIRAAYRHAIAQRYRFFSYGDAMLIERGS
ncbi:MAG: tRNA preQ1(34) S-adenosylmethionine ribosyltransferase-isomerase QueA [Betaproteobacteria bacterium]|nr:tRNA preQ1(34) S-adenosylmethionine ribosyltransferase-isomerase QueA [Betaproteobacteria bacterium]MDH5341767.1 tRNA preQ1(34) S-adenosylmethionine ribosyltransferase-isomerase QueA [Betaproteobacteria bacterium]